MQTHAFRPAPLAVALLVACAAPAPAPAPAPSSSPAPRQVPPPAPADAATYTRADSLRGSWTSPGRAWWDLTYYDLRVAISPRDSSIRGSNAIGYRVLSPGREMQIDLMTPLGIDSMIQDGRPVPFRRDGNVFFATLPAEQAAGGAHTLTVYYGGKPRSAKRPPWEGGFTWTTDSAGRPWIVTTDQGIGASIWWPNKDTQADEPDSMRIALTVPDPLKAVSSGRYQGAVPNGDGTTTYRWFVASPINNYAIAVNAGHYEPWADTLQGEAGPLSLDFWVLDRNRAAAERQWTQVKPSLQCLERWFGPYPWYRDGYKLIDVPYNGMEHQSAVTYGNGYANGYRGKDASGTGYGMKWDFIILHESAHEWWGNNVTTKDLRDMWIHAGFANYAEGLYTECLFGREAGAAYTIGTRKGIRNDRPVVPAARGVNAQGSGDMYPKGGNLLHTIRQLVNDDEKWRRILRGIQSTFARQTVLGEQVEAYIAEQSGLDLSKVFDQYLRDVRIPKLEYRIEGATLSYRWGDVVAGFAMPVEVKLPDGRTTTLRPTVEWQTMPLERAGTTLEADPDYYVEVWKLVEGRPAGMLAPATP